MHLWGLWSISLIVELSLKDQEQNRVTEFGMISHAGFINGGAQQDI